MVQTKLIPPLFTLQRRSHCFTRSAPVTCTASFICRTVSHTSTSHVLTHVASSTGSHTAPLPHFPTPHPSTLTLQIPTAEKGLRLYNADEVIAWSQEHYRKAYSEYCEASANATAYAIASAPSTPYVAPHRSACY